MKMGVNRSSYYYKPKPFKPEDLKLMRKKRLTESDGPRGYVNGKEVRT